MPRPGLFTPRERFGAYCIKGWVGPRASLDVYRASRPHRDWSPDRLAHSKSLYQLRYPGPHHIHVLVVFLDVPSLCIQILWTTILKLARLVHLLYHINTNRCCVEGKLQETEKHTKCVRYVYLQSRIYLPYLKLNTHFMSTYKASNSVHISSYIL